MSKKLTRSYDDRWLAGVLSGFAKYFNTKPLYLRIAYILFTAITGIVPGVIVYIVLLAIIYWILSNSSTLKPTPKVITLFVSAYI